jgi:hypothetical protein
MKLKKRWRPTLTEYRSFTSSAVQCSGWPTFLRCAFAAAVGTERETYFWEFCFSFIILNIFDLISF